MFSYTEENDTIIVSVSGNLDEEAAPRLRSYVFTFIESGYKHIIMDLQNVKFIASPGLAVLCVFKHRLEEDKGWVRLAALSSELKEILNFVMLTDMISVYDTVKEALSADS